MSDFKKFRALLQDHFNEMVKGENPLFITDADEDELYNLYLDSFPAGTNELFRKRREYDCSCCRRFVKNIGKLVAFDDGKMITVWDFDAKSVKYQPVVDALDAYVKSRTIVNPYFVSRNMIGSGDMFGTEMNYEYDENHKDVHTWDHFAVKIPQRFIVRPDDVATKMAQWRDSANVYKRSLEELTMDAVDTVLELIAQNSLYRGKEFENVVKVFKTNKIEYDNTPTENKAAYVWLAPAWSDIGQLRIRNTAIGTLLAESEARVDAAEKKAQRDKIMKIVAKKKDKELEDMDVDQLMKKLEELN